MVSQAKWSGRGNCRDSTLVTLMHTRRAEDSRRWVLGAWYPEYVLYLADTSAEKQSSNSVERFD
jgi:hypothetical protein